MPLDFLLRDVQSEGMRFLLLILLTACSPASLRTGLRWSARATEVAAQSSLACDWGSTNASTGHGYYETNPIMGTHPDHSVTEAYFVGIGSGVAIYNRVLPDALRIVANSLVVAVEIDAVTSNHSVGADPGYCGM